MKSVGLFVVFLLYSCAIAAAQVATHDVVVYGATPSGIFAAIECAKANKSVVLLEPGKHIGGMVTNGLGATDLYNPNAYGALVKEFFDRLAKQEGEGDGTRHEPHVAEQVYAAMLKERHGSVTLILHSPIIGVTKQGSRITEIKTPDASYAAKVFVDASYEGDLMAMAGVSYTIGRESSSKYGESLAGVQKPIVLDNVRIDPYRDGYLLPHVQDIHLPAPGSADDSLMAYNYRLCFSSDPENRIPFSRPDGYDPLEYELLGRYAEGLAKRGETLTLEKVFQLQKIPHGKLDVNNAGFFSTDEVGANGGYINASFAERHRIAAEHQRYAWGLLYFVATDKRIPLAIRDFTSSHGLCKDEFRDHSGWPEQLYVREVRRMVGRYVMTQKDLEGETSIRDSIGLGGYPVDSHFTNRVADDNTVKVEGWMYHKLPRPYPISYASLTPKTNEASNLLVSVAVSSSHVAYDSLRVEITYMVMGQAAGAAAALAVEKNCDVQNVDYGTLRTLLLKDGQVLNHTRMLGRLWLAAVFGVLPLVIFVVLTLSGESTNAA